MVSSGAVNNDANSFLSSLSNYQSSFQNVSSSWQGESYDNLNAKVEAFISEYKTAIQNQFTSFASACSSYEQYIQVKRELASVQSMAASDKTKDYSSQISQLTTRLNQLKTEIESSLSAASSPALSATAIGEKGSSTDTSGFTYSSSAIVESVISKAFEIANDDSHGYSQKTRWGNPNYDCSSFVITCWDSAGTGVKAAGASYTGNMRKAFLKTGLFEWYPGNPDMNSLQPGDILLNENQHTEMYIGDGQMIGSRGGDLDGRNGDGSGKEICVTKYHGGWQGVLRYIGDQSVSI